jgi:hypothetical protein
MEPSRHLGLHCLTHHVPAGLLDLVEFARYQVVLGLHVVCDLLVLLHLVLHAVVGLPQLLYLTFQLRPLSSEFRLDRVDL